ncbi:MAG: bifunctional 4-hydroxy-2-oxoglutarate aldolase/2-dehydro-3-deoxy-phosphogluconate aldolase [Candidatus Omnitrophica bacterium]|nr:bifunctional 4-hydroxy-2-oxoglutarate aldolase/2-dehydro-3-deoxy-phosphogluconate aldolase [Candidatus Omnitrophota bacterium]
MDVAAFRKLPIIGILRGIEEEQIEPLCNEMISAGLKTIEITMNTKGAAALIKKAVKVSSGRLTVGAGTVLDKKSLKEALDAGATFIVTPVLINDVVDYCVKHKIPVFPGALTPTEIYAAWLAGATMVKVFPVKVFGPSYIKEVRGPLDKIELLACAGVTPENLVEYFAAGASAVTFGASVFRKEWLEKKDYKSIGDLIKKYVSSFKEVAGNGKISG